MFRGLAGPFGEPFLWILDGILKSTECIGQGEVAKSGCPVAAQGPSRDSPLIANSPPVSHDIQKYSAGVNLGDAK